MSVSTAVVSRRCLWPLKPFLSRAYFTMSALIFSQVSGRIRLTNVAYRLCEIGKQELSNVFLRRSPIFYRYGVKNLRLRIGS